MKAAFLSLHVVMGLGIAGQSAQKLFGWFEGGINGTGVYGKGSNDFGLF
jgi:hypothetical protein